MLEEILHPACIDLSYPKRRRKQIIHRLVELADTTGAIREPNVLVGEILQRDSEVSTAVGNGVAIPHRLSALVDRPLLVFVRTKKAAGFTPPDGIPVHLCFLLLAPEGDVTGHLRSLSRLSRLLHDRTFRSALMQATDPKEVEALLHEREDPS
jgi:mannitol/fructose-specific phosphotransferase system IIA component (Ntr-type)